MTIAQIEANVKQVLIEVAKETFVFDLLLAYGMPKATISRLKKGELNQLAERGELLSR